MESVNAPFAQGSEPLRAGDTLASAGGDMSPKVDVTSSGSLSNETHGRRTHFESISRGNQEMKLMNNSIVLSALALLVTTCLPASAFSQTLDEVVVTAQKREQNLQDVSVSITAFTGAAMRELNMVNSVDIAGQTPGLNVGTPVGEGNNPSITLRGVGLNDFNDNNEGPIAIYRDEVYQAAMPGLTFQLFDLERVEVLRGPQGTLYGRNATGGLVHFISNKPTEEFGGYFDLSLGDNNQVKAEAAIGGALGESVQARLSVATNQYDGYVKNRIGPDGNEGDSLAYRLQANFQVTDSMDILVSVHGGRSDAIAPYYQHETTDFDGDGAPDPTDLYGYTDTDGDVWAGDYDQVGILDIENSGGSMVINWGGDKFDFTSITGVEGVDKLHKEDTDMGPSPGVLPAFGADIDSFSQEFRLSGSNDRMHWVAGAYFFNSDADNTLDLAVNYPDGFVAFLDSLPESEGGFEGGLGALTGYVPGPDPSALIPFLTYDVDYEQSTESMGLFGQVDYSVSDSFGLTFGLRYTTEERSFDYINDFGDRDGDGGMSNNDGVLTNFLYQLFLLDFFPPEVFAFSGDIDNDNISGKFGIEFRPSDDVMIFANYSRGFKSGGFNGGFLDLTDGIVPEDTPYDEEVLNSFEVGIKSTLADGRVRVNATAFVYDYEDYQALTFSGLSQFITNSDADLSGLEFELVWNPGDNWDFLIGASLLDTEVKEVFVQGVPVSGTEMVLAPEFTINGLGRYSIPLSADSWLALQLDFNHQADHFFDITNSEVSKEDSYTVLNARISYQVNQRLNLSAWVKNLTDEEYRVYTFDFTGIAGFNQQFFGPPQWFGVSARYEF